MKQIMGIGLILFFSSFFRTPVNNERNLENAQKLFRAVYGGHPELIEGLISDDFVSTYPIFEEIMNQKAIHGKEAYVKFASGYSQRWKDAKITIHETVAENDKVVLIWSYSAYLSTGNDQSGQDSGQLKSWGGITLFKFNRSGKITAEIGEESTPGPMGRLGY